MNQEWQNGQSLIEVLVAVAVGTIMVAGAMAIVSPTLKTRGDTARLQVASGVGKGLLENARVLSESNWHAFDALATTSANKYYIVASTSPFTVASGVESVDVGTTTYTRYFYLGDVYRNGSGYIDPAGTAFDPSTKKITIVYGWASTTESMDSYLGRTWDQIFAQTDWSGGPNQSGPITSTSTNAQFATSSNMNYTTSSGALVIQGF